MYEAFEMIEDIPKVYKNERDNVDSGFQIIIDQPVRMADKVGCTVSALALLEGSSIELMSLLLPLLSTIRGMLPYHFWTMSSLILMSSFQLCQLMLVIV